ncbi:MULTISPECIES: hypothetical protein [Enterobacter]|uniref:hypothetical protein n=1 Tax=Enterobacter TaxID=547 RepID=UPI0013D7AD41|nr:MULTISPECIES: hypothetical protein [Enterobacter]MBE3287896.1 hypothetical protein [Enterobacter cloacae complex sp. P31C]MDO2441935.1 hypothetical protein [Enterobacter nematophilus]
MEFVSGLLSTVNSWLTHSGVIPASAFITIMIFLIKEHLESRRKKKSKENEISALKKIFARECELNWYLSSQIERLCRTFKPYEDDAENCPYELSILTTPSGKTTYEITGDEQGMEGGALPQAHADVFKKFMYDVVKHDAEFYEHLESAYEAALELRHLRDSIVDIHHTGERIHVDNLMLGFSGYALIELKSINIDIKALYKFCTGKSVIIGRLR